MEPLQCYIFNLDQSMQVSSLSYQITSQSNISTYGSVSSDMEPGCGRDRFRTWRHGKHQCKN